MTCSKFRLAFYTVETREKKTEVHTALTSNPSGKSPVPRKFIRTFKFKENFLYLIQNPKFNEPLVSFWK